MKKMMMILLFLTVCAVMSSSAFAAYATGSFDVGSQTSLTVKTSKNVYMQVTTSGTSNPVANYVEQSYHSTGSRTFGTSNADQKLFYIEGTAAAQTSVPSASGEAPTWGSNWQVL